MDDFATERFQHSIAYTLYQASPALSSLHTRRTRRKTTHPTPDAPLNCANCGVFLFGGDSSTRFVRSKSKRRTDTSKSRTRQSTCFQCGCVTEHSVDRGSSASLFPRRKRSKPLLVSDAKPDVPVKVATSSIGGSAVSKELPSHRNVIQLKPDLPQSTSSSSTSTSTSDAATKAVTPGKPKPRPKKKTGLQEMLAHNRAKEEKAKKAAPNAGHSGLAAFLESL